MPTATPGKPQPHAFNVSGPMSQIQNSNATETKPVPSEPRTQSLTTAPQRLEEPGRRNDAGKLRFDLLPPDALEELVLVYTRGAEKYSDRNWERGMSWSRCFASLMRHCWAFWRGYDVDPETGCHHMALAAWNCLALCTYSIRKAGTDDRPQP